MGFKHTMQDDKMQHNFGVCVLKYHVMLPEPGTVFSAWSQAFSDTSQRDLNISGSK